MMPSVSYSHTVMVPTCRQQQRDVSSKGIAINCGCSSNFYSCSDLRIQQACDSTQLKSLFLLISVNAIWSVNAVYQVVYHLYPAHVAVVADQQNGDVCDLRCWRQIGRDGRQDQVSRSLAVLTLEQLDSQPEPDSVSDVEPI